MIRVQAPLVFIIFVAGFLVSSIFLVRSSMEDALDEDATNAIRSAAVAAEQSARLDEAALLAKAQLVASSDPLYRALNGEIKLKKAEAPAEEGAEGETADDESDPEGERHLVVHEKLSIGRIALDDLAKQQAVLRNVERGPLARDPIQHEVFMVLDDKGVGVAALGKDLYSWFGDDVGKTFPIVNDVMKARGIDRIGEAARIDYWMWSFNPTDEKKLYRVAIVPVRRNIDEEPAGVVVIGNSINDGLATSKRDLFAGQTAAGDSASYTLDSEVAFLAGGEVVGSSFTSEKQKTLGGAIGSLPESSGETDAEVLDITIGETPYMAVRRNLGASYGGEAFQVLVMANTESVMKPLENLQVNLIFLGVLILIFGAGLILFFIIRWEQPFDSLESGLQEVLAGNKDYVWEPKEGHSIQESLAQGLNLVSAYLQGKPMPDEEATGSNWADFMGGDSGGGGSSTPGKPKVGGVAIPGMSPPPREDEGEDDS